MLDEFGDTVSRGIIIQIPKYAKTRNVGLDSSRLGSVLSEIRIGVGLIQAISRNAWGIGKGSPENLLVVHAKKPIIWPRNPVELVAIPTIMDQNLDRHL
jgi:hypothetical protein